MFRIVKGSTLLVPSGPAHDPDRKHLHIALTDPLKDASDGEIKVVLVGVCTVPYDGPYDATCIIRPGEHAFVSRKSYVYYAFATIYPVESLARRYRDGTCQKHDPFLGDVFARILKGALDSLHTKQRIRGLCRAAYQEIDDDRIPF
jgi:hypothetical protein